MIYRKLSPSVSPSFSFSSSFLSRSGKIRETWLRRASPYGSSSYSQDRTDFHDRRIFAAAYYELCPWFPLALYPGSPRVTAFPSHGVILPEAAPRSRGSSPLATTQFRPREISSMRRMKKTSEMRRMTQRVVFVSYTYFTGCTRPCKARGNCLLLLLLRRTD